MSNHRGEGDFNTTRTEDLSRRRSSSLLLTNSQEHNELLYGSRTINIPDARCKAIDLSGQVGYQYDASRDIVVRSSDLHYDHVSLLKSNSFPDCGFIKGETANIDTLIRALFIQDHQILNILLHSRFESANGTHVALLDSEKWSSERTRILFYRQTFMERYLTDKAKHVLLKNTLLKPEATHIITSVSFGIEVLIVLKARLGLSMHEVDGHLQHLCLALRSNNELVGNDAKYLDDLQIIKTYSNSTKVITQTNMSSVHKQIRHWTTDNLYPIFYQLRPIQFNAINYEITYGTIYNVQVELFTLRLLFNKAQSLLNIHNKSEYCEQFEKVKQKYGKTQNFLKDLIVKIHRRRECEYKLAQYFVQADYHSLKSDLEQLVKENQTASSSLYDISLSSAKTSMSPTKTLMHSSRTSLDSTKTVNTSILLLGETGVGKSTFINALANYMHFKSLIQARKNDPVVLIPTSFIITRRPHFKEITVNIGEPDPNENHNKQGESVTQHCKSYSISINNYPQLNIVDTPGVGDTRGVQQDKANINTIQSFIENLDHINAICILLKPNVERLHPSFRVCLTQLFNLLGPTVRKNIVFCFTNTRATFYRPANTAVLLNHLLDKLPGDRIDFSRENTFCFDSESFRYLAATKQGMKFEGKEEDEYEESWAKSVSETKRFLDYIMSLDRIILGNDNDTDTAISWNSTIATNVF